MRSLNEVDGFISSSSSQAGIYILHALLADCSVRVLVVNSVNELECLDKMQ